ncbi:MAG: excinuclease ABC subunit UvrA, partial [Clostridiaceae bacterium]|nr:excinuclease ABC subunit UvrA [Clostridiaceae bacterium]
MAAQDHAIVIKGAREHNLKNINLRIPREKLVVLTGLSGSGKSSLAFDTIYAEGQRRYVESLSSYARQFLGQMVKPDIDSIEGLSPAISIDQKTTSKNPRSTVGTVTEIYDYLRLLFARAGTPHCPVCGRPIEKQSIDQIIEQVLAHPEGTRLLILSPIIRDRRGEYKKLLDQLRKNGFVRVRADGEVRELDEDFDLDRQKKHTIEAVIDRLVIRDGIRSRLSDSLETALEHSENRFVRVQFQEEVGMDSAGERQWQLHEEIFSENFACPECNVSISEIAPRMFSFNNPQGACPDCTGLGSFRNIDPDLVIDDENLSLNEGCITVGGWKFADRKSWARSYIEALAENYGLDLDRPWRELDSEDKHLVLFGNQGEKINVDTSNSKYNRGDEYRSAWEGVIPSMMRRYAETSNDEMRAYYEAYMSETVCETCHGARLKPESLSVSYGKKNIYELCSLPIRGCKTYIHEQLHELTPQKREVAERISQELDARLQFLIDVGLDYMTLARASATLSGGEAQRIRLATQIGSGLMGVLYILDEPSIGLHQRDNRRLLNTLEHLRDIGNTVLVVEHDEETMFAADYIVDIGPGAGEQGGKVVAVGDVYDIMRTPESITGQYLSGARTILIPEARRQGNGSFLTVKGAAENNLKEIDVSIPLGTFCCITGVSGSGKSSLVNGIILPTLEARLNRARRKAGKHRSIEGYDQLDKVIAIDQSPIGRTPRSNPATYTG